MQRHVAGVDQREQPEDARRAGRTARRRGTGERLTSQPARAAARRSAAGGRRRVPDVVPPADVVVTASPAGRGTAGWPLAGYGPGHADALDVAERRLPGLVGRCWPCSTRTRASSEGGLDRRRPCGPGTAAGDRLGRGRRRSCRSARRRSNVVGRSSRSGLVAAPRPGRGKLPWRSKTLACCSGAVSQATSSLASSGACACSGTARKEPPQLPPPPGTRGDVPLAGVPRSPALSLM